MKMDIDKELKKIREKIEDDYKRESGEGTKKHPISWCIKDSWDDLMNLTKEKVSQLIFLDIDKIINKTTSSVPVLIKDSKLLEALKKLKKEYCNK